MMSPVLAQLLVAAVQALIQAIESKLCHESRILLIVDPDVLTDVEDQRALERLAAKARLVRHFGPEEGREDPK